MGFEVYDYAGGLEDWANAGEDLAGGQGGGRPLLVSLIRQVPTLALDATVAEARSAIGDEAFLLVVGDDGVVLGKVLTRSLEQEGVAGTATLDTVLIEGPTTVRPTEHLPSLVERMRRAGTGSVLVTSNQGELLGVLHLAAAEEAIQEASAGHDHSHIHER